jgi:hypothetical protein
MSNVLLGNKREKDETGLDYDNYDNIRSENQNKVIAELKAEIEEFKRRERAFITHLHLKEKEIYYLENSLRQSNQALREKSNSDFLVDHAIHNELNKLKIIIKEKDEKLLQKEEEHGMQQATSKYVKYNILYYL